MIVCNFSKCQPKNPEAHKKKGIVLQAKMLCSETNAKTAF